MTAQTPTALPTPAEVYATSIRPLALAAADQITARRDGFAWPTSRDTLAERAAHRLCLQLAEHAADQCSDEPHMRAVLAALIAADTAARALAVTPDCSGAISTAQDAADTARHALEATLHAWGMDG